MKYFIVSAVFLSFMSFPDSSFAFFKADLSRSLDKIFEIKVLEMIKFEFAPSDAKEISKTDLLIKRLKELDKERRLI